MLKRGILEKRRPKGGERKRAGENQTRNSSGDIIATIESAASDKATSDTKLAEQIERSQKVINERVLKAKKSEFATIDSLVKKVTHTEN